MVQSKQVRAKPGKFQPARPAPARPGTMPGNDRGSPPRCAAVGPGRWPSSADGVVGGGLYRGRRDSSPRRSRLPRGDSRVLVDPDHDRAVSCSNALAGAEPLRLMAVHAHPDDESSKGAATMARYVRSGVDVLVCTLTGGERGDILNPAMDRPEVRADLPAIRRAEMEAARQILGVSQQFLGFTDSGLPEGDPLPPLPAGCFALEPLESAARPLVQAVREFRPHVMLTYDENGGYPHPDHIKCHEVSVEAF